MILGMSSSKASSALSKVLSKSNIRAISGSSSSSSSTFGVGVTPSIAAFSTQAGVAGPAPSPSASPFQRGRRTTTAAFSSVQSRRSSLLVSRNSNNNDSNNNDNDKARLFSTAAVDIDEFSATGGQMTPAALLESFKQQQGVGGVGRSSLIGNSIEGAMFALYTADAVCFDVDSTVIAEEGIDVLAEYLGKGEEVAALTRQAMDGGMKFQDALAMRLDLLRPARSSILKLLHDQPLQLTPGISDLMKSLQAAGVDIWLVSGGFRIMIEPVAKLLNISPANIYANTLLFKDDVDGSYNGFDPTEPTSADMGKPSALSKIKTQMGYKTMVMVGDGATDAQAKPPASAFIGFGGVIERQAVKASADWFVTDFQDMAWVIEQRTNVAKSQQSK